MTTAFPAWDPWNYRADSGYTAGGEHTWTGYHIEATDGRIGSVEETTHETDASFIIVDTGPWIFGKTVMIPAGLVSRVDAGERTLYVDLSKKQIKDAPLYETHNRDEPDYRDKLGTYYRGFHHHGAL